MEKIGAREGRFVSQEAIAAGRRPDCVSPRQMRVLFNTTRIAQENGRSGLVVPFNVSYPFARRRAEFKAKEEISLVAQREKPWGAYTSNVARYETSFVRVWGVMDRSFGTFLGERRAEKGSTYLMEVMGPADFLPSYRRSE